MFRTGKIQNKILIFHAAMLAFALVASASAIYVFTSGFLTGNAQESNSDAARLAENVIERDIEQAALFSRLISENYQIRVSLAEMDARPIEAKFKIKQQLLIELSSLSADFISVSRADGVIFAHETRGGAIRETPLEREPMFLSRAFQTAERSGRTAVGVEPVYPNTLAVVAVSPVSGPKSGVAGYLRLGYRLDRRFVQQIRNVTRTHIAVIHRGIIVASTLPAKTDSQGNEIPLEFSSLKNGYLLQKTSILQGSDSGAVIVSAYPAKKLETVRRRTTAVIALIALATFALSIPVSSRLATIIVAPLRDLMSGVGSVESGNLETQIPECGTDEICALAKSFNRMTGSLRARDDEIRSNQDQLIESGKLAAVGELAAGVAHEIGNPLAAISGYLQLLKGDISKEKMLHFVEEMEREAGFIDSTIRELLDFARPSRNEDDAVDINSAIEECLRILSFHSSMQKATVEKSLSPGAPCVTGSKRELLQAFMNLTLNAAQSMPDGGRIRIEAATAADDFSGTPVAKVSISDEGPGIDEETMTKIFDPFFTTKRAGTGLGLSITYRIIKRHNGEIRVYSAPGKGTTFTIALPLRSAPEATI